MLWLPIESHIFDCTLIIDNAFACFEVTNLSSLFLQLNPSSRIAPVTSPKCKRLAILLFVILMMRWSYELGKLWSRSFESSFYTTLYVEKIMFPNCWYDPSPVDLLIWRVNSLFFKNIPLWSDSTLYNLTSTSQISFAIFFTATLNKIEFFITRYKMVITLSSISFGFSLVILVCMPLITIK